MLLKEAIEFLLLLQSLQRARQRKENSQQQKHVLTLLILSGNHTQVILTAIENVPPLSPASKSHLYESRLLIVSWPESSCSSPVATSKHTFLPFRSPFSPSHSAETSPPGVLASVAASGGWVMVARRLQGAEGYGWGLKKQWCSHPGVGNLARYGSADVSIRLSDAYLIIMFYYRVVILSCRYFCVFIIQAKNASSIKKKCIQLKKKNMFEIKNIVETPRNAFEHYLSLIEKEFVWSNFYDWWMLIQLKKKKFF